MHPDIVLFIILLVLIFGMAARIVYFRAKKKPIGHKWTESIKYLGLISLALGILLQMIELSTALEHITNDLTTEEIAKGLRSTLFATIHGLLVYSIAMVVFVILKLTDRSESRLDK
jgi:energy-coupling factor transporter transmembrane protein EcfT